MGFTISRDPVQQQKEIEKKQTLFCCWCGNGANQIVTRVDGKRIPCCFDCIPLKL